MASSKRHPSSSTSTNTRHGGRAMGNPLMMAMPAGQSVLGGIEANKAKHTSEKLYGKSEKFFDLARTDISSLYDQALSKLGGAGATAKQNISTLGKQDVGALGDSAISRGLYGTSYLDAGKR